MHLFSVPALNHLPPFFVFNTHTKFKSVATSMQNRTRGELEDFLLKFQKAKWRKLFIMQCLLSDDKTRHDCPPVCSLYVVDSHFQPPRKVAGKVIFGADLDHTARVVPMHERALPLRRWWLLQTCSHIKMLQMNWFPYRWILRAWIEQFSSALLAVAIRPVVLLSPSEWSHTHTLSGRAL